MRKSFRLRALEIHAHGMWSESHVRKALDFIGRYEMNALVFHGTDIVHTITFPRKHFGQNVAWSDAPPRRGENAIFNNRAYIQNVTRLCREAGIRFYLEVKEIAFPEEILEVFPDLMQNGVVCPSDPRWLQFLEVKYEELFEDFAGIAGVIVSVGSHEGRAAMAARRCKCERCRSTTLPEWYRDVTASLHKAAVKYGRTLIVREFSYRPEDQRDVIAGLAASPTEIGYMAKAYPHDFYPPFPDNPGLGAFKERETWLEYDVCGQYFGWGIFPCFVADDIRRRFRAALANDMDGVILRTDWERINDLSCLDTANIVNLACGAQLALDVDADPQESMKVALLREDLIEASLYSETALDELVETLARLLPAFNQALYIKGFVLNSSSMYPHGIAHAWWTLMTKHSLHIWSPGAETEIDVGRPENVQSMLAEKDAALVEIEQIASELKCRYSQLLRLPEVGRVGDIVSLLPRYIEGFVRTGKVVVLAKAMEAANEQSAGYRPALEKAVAELTAYHEWLARWVDETLYAHHLYMLMDPARTGGVLAEARALLGKER